MAATKVYIIRWCGSFGYCSEAKDAKSGAFVHKSQFAGVGIEGIQKGDAFDLDGEFGSGDKGPCIYGVLRPLDQTAELARQKSESHQRYVFSEEFLKRYGHRPSFDLTKVFTSGGWEAVDAQLAAEAARHAAAQPPPRMAFDKRKVPQV